LEQGIPLPEALRRSRNYLPFDARLACGVGWQAGCLGPALRRVVDFQEEYDAYVRSVIEKAVYFVLLFGALGVAFTFLMVKIVPAMALVYGEFALELPVVSQWLFAMDDPIRVWQWWLVLAPLYAALYTAAPICLLYYLGWVRWEPWLLRRVWRRVHTAWVLRFLGFLVAQNRPMEQNVRLLSANYPATYIAQRLYAATGLLAAGHHWCDALQAKKLIRASDAAVLKAAERAGNLAWALEEMAESNLRRLALRFRAVLAIVFPLVMLATGAVLAVIAISLLAPLFFLLEGLA
jgi:general secretion pathway protein F